MHDLILLRGGPNKKRCFFSLRGLLGDYDRVRVSRFGADPNSRVQELKKKGDTVHPPKWKSVVDP